ncbi:13158_t:CDS:2 [Entrophospora sp. SA101]|nr:3905_t:CDS:2 [Entrophospora sp. SA101]CAJ0761249.1 13158_t:CDS:2 [Entrophospora sp. SA101]CAJ0851614.1 797_t:CDS:2 [Entrophospora sp. SA101]
MTKPTKEEVILRTASETNQRLPKRASQNRKVITGKWLKASGTAYFYKD